MCRDALHREESCGAHYRLEHRTEEGEPRRDDEGYQCVFAWEHRDGAEPAPHREELTFDFADVIARSYK